MISAADRLLFNCLELCEVALSFTLMKHICGTHLASSRSQLGSSDSGTTTRWGCEMPLSLQATYCHAL
jgi:hypothetical protein